MRTLLAVPLALAVSTLLSCDYSPTEQFDPPDASTQEAPLASTQTTTYYWSGNTMSFRAADYTAVRLVRNTARTQVAVYGNDVLRYTVGYRRSGSTVTSIRVTDPRGNWVEYDRNGSLLRASEGCPQEDPHCLRDASWSGSGDPESAVQPVAWTGVLDLLGPCDGQRYTFMGAAAAFGVNLAALGVAALVPPFQPATGFLAKSLWATGLGAFGTFAAWRECLYDNKDDGCSRNGDPCDNSVTPPFPVSI